MKRVIFIFLGSIILLSGCVKQNIVTKQDAFPEMYKQHPLSILVVPVVNHSTAADAPDLYSTTIVQPLAEAGYYVMPIPITDMIFHGEGIVDGEQLKNVDATKFKSLFGADSALFVTINKWDTNYYLTGGNVTVGADFRLISTTNNEELWHYDTVIIYNTSGNSGNLIADLISTAISTAVTDYVPIARRVNANVIHTLPVGKYNSRYERDGTDRTVNKDSSVVRLK